MVRWRERLSLTGIILGILLYFGGEWLGWDLARTLAYYMDYERFVFPFPFFAYTVYSDKWSLPYDIGLAMRILGIIVAFIGAIIIVRVKE